MRSQRHIQTRLALALLTIAASWLWGCVLSSPPKPQATLPPPQTVSGPISEKQIKSAIEQLDRLAPAVLDETGIAGLAVAVVWRGKTVYAKGFGLRELGSKKKVDADTVFQPRYRGEVQRHQEPVVARPSLVGVDALGCVDGPIRSGAPAIW